jgi:hypothetical protein
MMTTRRTVHAQIMVCVGCCCGNIAKGNPAVPTDWLKMVWKSEKLHPYVHLTVSGCLGPCDVINVVAIITPTGQHWFGGIRDEGIYRSLYEWARMCKEADKLLPIPTVMEEFRFDRFGGVQ